MPLLTVRREHNPALIRLQAAFVERDARGRSR
jgi:hypothetical protein